MTGETPAIVVRLDEPAATYGPGDTIGGSIVVTGVAPAHVDVRAAMRVHGPGTPAERHGPAVTLAGPDAFALEAPRWPASYDGQYAQLAWAVEAVATYHDGREERARAPFRLEARADDPFVAAPVGLNGRPDRVRRRRPRPVGPAPHRLAAGCFVVIGLAFVAMAAWAVLIGGAHPATLIGAVLAALLLGLWGRRTAQRASAAAEALGDDEERAAGAIGDPQIAVRWASRDDYRSGGGALAVDVFVAADAPPVDVDAELVVVERAAMAPTYEATSDTVEYARDHARSLTRRREHRAERELLRRRIPMRAAEPGRYAGELALPSPREAPGSLLDLPECTILWRVQAVVRWPEGTWTKALHRDLRVAPRSMPDLGADVAFGS